MFADDVAIWVQDTDLAATERRPQGALDAINDWSDKWKMTLSASKSECSFFSTNSHEARWIPSLSLNGQAIRFNANPKFLGVTYD